MAWMYLPQYLSVQVTKGLVLDLNEQSRILEQSVTSRTKHTRSQTWLRRLKKNAWMTLLSGMTLKPLTRNLLLGWLTSFIPDILVNHFQSPASEKVRPMNGISGRLSEIIYGRLDLFTVSLRTWQDIFDSDSIEWSEIWTSWVTQLRLTSLRRRKLALHTNESGCLSWPTIRASDGQHGGPNQRDSAGKPALPAAVHWRTPNGSDGEGGIMENLPGKDGRYKLRDQVNWLTPKQPSGGGCPRNTPGGGLRKLEDQVECGLPAPDKSNTNGKNRGQLNPAWVEQLMGLEKNWTDLPAEWID